MQKRKKLNIVTAFVLTIALAIGIPCYAGTTQEEIDSVIAQNEETQASLVSVEERIAALEAQKGDTESYLQELADQIEDLNKVINDLEEKLAAKQEEIAVAEKELEESKETEHTQYEDMKKRIQYIYEESAGAGLLESLFSAESFSDFLNRSEEMAQINQFDREMLSSYSRTVEDIEEKEALLLSEQAELEELQASMQEQKAAVEMIYENSYRELEACLWEIQNNENAQTELASQIQAQEAWLDQLMARKFAEEEAARLQREAEEAAARAAAEAACQEAAAQQQAEEEYYAQVAAQQAAAQGSAYVSGEEDAGAAYEETAAEAVPVSMTYLGNFTLTAYCSCAKCCGKWAAYAGTTASGAHVQEGVTVAMGGVPFGTQLYINGHIYTVQDRGTPYGHVDIYFSTHQAACAFGLKHADVYQVN